MFGASENSTQNAEGFGENGGAIVADGRSHEETVALSLVEIAKRMSEERAQSTRKSSGMAGEEHRKSPALQPKHSPSAPEVAAKETPNLSELRRHLREAKKEVARADIAVLETLAEIGTSGVCHALLNCRRT